jgi:hypothetical protein
MAERNTTKPKTPAAKPAKEPTKDPTKGKTATARTPAPTPPSTKAPTKASKPAPTKPAAKKSVTAQAAGSLQVAVERLEARMAELKRERDALAVELAAAHQQITALEAARTQAINRIDWVLDSLQSLTEDKS